MNLNNIDSSNDIYIRLHACTLYISGTKFYYMATSTNVYLLQK